MYKRFCEVLERRIRLRTLAVQFQAPMCGSSQPYVTSALGDTSSQTPAVTCTCVHTPI